MIEDNICDDEQTRKYSEHETHYNLSFDVFARVFSILPRVFFLFLDEDVPNERDRNDQKQINVHEEKHELPDDVRSRAIVVLPNVLQKENQHEHAQAKSCCENVLIELLFYLLIGKQWSF